MLKNNTIIRTVAAGMFAMLTAFTAAAYTQAELDGAPSAVSQKSDENKIMLYAPDGRVVEVDKSKKQDYLLTGWSENKTTLTSTYEKPAYKFGSGTLFVLNADKLDEIDAECATAVRRAYVAGGTNVVGEEAFAGCTNLTRVEISDTVREIESYAFADCPIERIGIPASVEKIADDAFGAELYEKMVIYCEKNSAAEGFAKKNGIKYVIASIIYAPDMRTAMVDSSEYGLYLRGGWYPDDNHEYEALYSLDGRSIYVRKDYANDYKSAGWYTYKDLMVYGKSASVRYGGTNSATKRDVSGEYLAICYLEQLIENSQSENWTTEAKQEIRRICDEWYARIKCPIGVGFADTVNGRMGIPNAKIEIYNLSEKTVKSYEVQFTCRGKNGEKVSNSTYLSAVNVGYDIDCNMKAYAHRTISFELKNNENAVYVDSVLINKVEFEDGTVWKRG